MLLKYLRARTRPTLATTVIAAALTSTAHADTDRFTPFEARAAHQALLDHAAYADVEVGQRVHLDRFPVDAGAAVDLELERFSVLTPGAQTLIVDEHGVERHVDLGVVLLRGTVAGQPESKVFISTSPHGVHGYIRTPDDTYAISTGPAAGDAIAFDPGLMVADTRGISGAKRPVAACVDSPELEILAQYGIAPLGYAQTRRLRATRETELAIDTDYEYTAVTFGGDAQAAGAYIQTVMGAVSTIYEDNIDTAMKVTWTRTFSSNNDPYPDYTFDENDPEAPHRLDHFKNEWDANMTAIDRDGAHLFTGTSPPYGGIAYLSALCYNVANGQSESFDYGVSAYLNGFFPTPMVDNNWSNWDLVVIAHELGHNHGTGHTHSIDWYNPTIDDCGNGDCSNGCDATIMSYCHTCPQGAAPAPCQGGLANIDLRFHPRVQDTMTFFLDNFAPCVTAPSAPCTADVDGDGDVDPDDINAFVNAFTDAVPLNGDIDGDGDEDPDDITAFVNAFVSGC